jgi:PPM family protein phosphatase
MLEFGKALDVGIKRRGNKNQDALKIVRPPFKPPMLIVADGMGGFRGGSEASQIVIKTLARAHRKPKRSQSLADLLSNAILETHQNIIKRSKKSDSLAKMGSTVAAVVLDEKGQKLTVANVGDTRVYLISPSGIEVISYDHSEVAELKRSGVLTDKEAQDYARKNVLTMSLMASRPPETIKPFITQKAFPPDAVVLLCSDGLWGSVPDHLIRLTALEFPPIKAAAKLVEFANTSGGPDNIAVLIARRKGAWKDYINKHAISFQETIS